MLREYDFVDGNLDESAFIVLLAKRINFGPLKTASGCI